MAGRPGTGTGEPTGLTNRNRATITVIGTFKHMKTLVMRLLESVLFVSILSVCITWGVRDGMAQTPEPTSVQEVRLFQSFFSDARITGRPYWGGGLSIGDSDGRSSAELDAVVGYTIIPELEMHAQLGFLRSSPDEGDSSSGFTDLLVVGQYLFDDVRVNAAGDVLDIAAGGYVDLPAGQSDVGGNTLDFGLYGAARYPMNDRTTLTGNLGLNSADPIETGIGLIGFCPGFYFGYCATPRFESGRATSVSIGAGALYQASGDVYLVGEFRAETEFDYAALSGGVDYTTRFGHLRGALAAGLADGAPDVSLVAQVLRPF